MSKAYQNLKIKLNSWSDFDFVMNRSVLLEFVLPKCINKNIFFFGFITFNIRVKTSFLILVFNTGNEFFNIH